MDLLPLNKKSIIRRVIYLNYEIKLKTVRLTIGCSLFQRSFTRATRTSLKVYKAVIQRVKQLEHNFE